LLAVEAAFYLSFSPIIGYIADHTAARRLPYLFGLVLLAASMAMQIASHSTGLYVAGRALQGASAAVVYVVGLALVIDTAPAKQIGQYMGYVAMAMTVGILLGPILGGVVYDTAGYYAVFGMIFGLIGWDICIRLTMIEKKVAARWLVAPPASDIENLSRKKAADLGEVLQAVPQSQEPEESNRNAGSAARTPSAKQKRILDSPTLILLRSPRLLATLWSCVVIVLIITSFDSVSL